MILFSLHNLLPLFLPFTRCLFWALSFILIVFHISPVSGAPHPAAKDLTPILLGYFVNTDKLILNFSWKGKRPKIANAVLKKHKVRCLTPPDFKSYYKTSPITYRSKNRHIYPRNRIESPEIDPRKCSK